MPTRCRSKNTRSWNKNTRLCSGRKPFLSLSCCRVIKPTDWTAVESPFALEAGPKGDSTACLVCTPFAPEDIARAICCLKDYLDLFISKVEFGPAQGMKLSRAHEKVGADIGNGERLSGQRLKTFEAFKYFKVKYGWTPSRWKGLMLTIMDEIVPDLFARFNKQKVPYIKLGTLSEDTREQKLRRLFANK